MDRLETPTVQSVQAPLPRASHTHQANLPQNPQMLGDLRLLETQRHDNIVHRPLPFVQQAKDLASLGFCNCVENVRGCCQACHLDIIYRYGNMSNPKKDDFIGSSYLTTRY